MDSCAKSLWGRGNDPSAQRMFEVVTGSGLEPESLQFLGESICFLQNPLVDLDAISFWRMRLLLHDTLLARQSMWTAWDKHILAIH